LNFSTNCQIEIIRNQGLLGLKCNNFLSLYLCKHLYDLYVLDRRFGGGHHFQYQVEHGDETTSPRPTPMDKPIIFPGDLRFLRQGEEDIEEGPPLAPFTTTPAPPIARNPVPLSTPTTTSVPPLVQRRPQSCGISVESRLLGGEQATAGQYPWLARIAYRNRSEYNLEVI